MELVESLYPALRLLCLLAVCQQPHDHGSRYDEKKPHEAVLRFDAHYASHAEDCDEGKEPRVDVSHLTQVTLQIR